MRALALIVALALAGCCGTAEFHRPPSTGGPDDLTHLIDADPSAVTSADLTASLTAAEARLRDATVYGVVWPRSRTDAALAEPNAYGSGGDSLLFTGVATAAWAWKWTVTGDPTAIADLADTIEGLRLLTSATGTPGVMCRCALPLSRAADFGWPWEHREPFVGEHAGFGYYTRATRDQLSGLVLGLAAAWRALEGDASPLAVSLRSTLAAIGSDTLGHIKLNEWHIRDQNGQNDTSADEVDGLLRLCLEGFVAVSHGDDTTDIASRAADHYASFWEALVRWSNRFNNADQYFGHNLRVMRTLTLALLALDDGAALREHSRDAWWRYVGGHRNAWFEGAWMVISGEDRSDSIRRSLASWSLRPARGWASPYAGQEQTPGYLDALFNCTEGYVVDPQLRKPTSYSTWQKEPWDVGQPDDPEGLAEDNGLSLTAGFWLWKYASR